MTFVPSASFYKGSEADFTRLGCPGWKMIQLIMPAGPAVNRHAVSKRRIQAEKELLIFVTPCSVNKSWG